MKVWMVAPWVLFAACSGDGVDKTDDVVADADTDVDADADADVDTDTDADTDTDPTGDTSDPGIVLLGGPTITMAELAPLTARLELTTDVPTALTATLDDGERTWSLSWDEPTEAHVVPLVGGRAERTVAVTLSLTAGGAPLVVDAGHYTTPALPAGLQLIRATASDPARMEPGYTLLSAAGYLVLIDEGAEVVWCAASRGAVHELLPAGPGGEGRWRYVANRTHVREVDPFGEVVGGWHTNQVDDPLLQLVDVDALHHDVQHLPDGTLLGLSIERRQLDYPTSEIDPDAPTAPTWVAGDVLVHFDRSGQVLGSWPLLDRLDPTRIGYDSVDGVYWHDFGPWLGDDTADWSHGNAVHYDPASDRFLVGLRHQDAVVALEHATGEVAWILAPSANWTGDAPDELLVPGPGVEVLPYHMHGAKFTASDRVIVFDNGNRRASAFEPVTPPDQVFSRVVEYAIQEPAGTFTEHWSYGLDEQLFSGSLGDADVLPATDNVLITWGNVKDDPRGTARIQEVTRGGETVFDVWMPVGTLFRTERVPSLLP